jgi:hypothetical protein
MPVKGNQFKSNSFKGDTKARALFAKSEKEKPSKAKAGKNALI